MVRSMSPAIEANHTDAGAVYLTDEVFLYRVAGLEGSSAGEVVELEDCYGLDVVKVSAADLHARRLRVVRPASGPPATLAGQRSSTMSSRGCEQQRSTLPSGGGSTGSGL